MFLPFLPMFSLNWSMFFAANVSIDERQTYTIRHIRLFVLPAALRISFCGWLGSRVVSVLDSGAVGPGFKSQPRVTVSGKLFTPIVPVFTKQRNWYQPS